MKIVMEDLQTAPIAAQLQQCITAIGLLAARINRLEVRIRAVERKVSKMHDTLYNGIDLRD